MSRKTNRGKTNLLENKDLKPGSMLMLDLQSNPSKYGINTSTHFKYYLQITNDLTRFTVLLGLSEVSSYSVFQALLHYSIHFKPHPDFEISQDLTQVHADAGSAFTSKEFLQDCQDHQIKVSLAAPRHQEMNGICERTWQNIHNIAFSFFWNGIFLSCP